MHFLIQTDARDIPVAPEKSVVAFKNENPTVSVLEKKEIYLLPIVRMSNLLHSQIDAILSETGIEIIATLRLYCGSRGVLEVVILAFVFIPQNLYLVNFYI